MTNEQAIQRAAESLLHVRVNKDGRLNGNALHQIEKGMVNTFKKNGMEHNPALTKAREIMAYLKARTTIAA